MFEKLIEAARTCYESGNPIDECCIEGCPNFDSQPYCLDQILKDSVEALTQSGAELKDKDYLIQKQADEIERLRRDVKKQQEKMIELAKKLPKRGVWIETEEKEWGIYPFKKHTCSVCDCKIDHIFMRACMDYFDYRDTVFHYCPNCGAKMEAQDGSKD